VSTFGAAAAVSVLRPASSEHKRQTRIVINTEGGSREPGMKTWIALFRGINVVGKSTLPMSELASVLEAIG